MDRVRSAIARALFGVSVALTTLALAGLCGSAIGWPDALSHLAPPVGALAALAGVAAAAAAARLSLRIITVVIVALTTVALVMTPEFVRSAGPTAPRNAPGQVKVIQINALRTNADVGRVAAWLVAQHPDIVTVSEARHDLRDRMIGDGWRTAGAMGSLMIFTRERYLRMDRPHPPAGERVTFVNATYAHPGGQIEVVTTHVGWPTEAGISGQTRGLAAVAASLPRERMILTGDFNATPWSKELRGLDRSLGLTRRDRAVATYPAQLLGLPWPFPFLPIDHVYAGPGWATVSVTRGPWLGSDHYPLVVILAPLAQP